MGKLSDILLLPSVSISLFVELALFLVLSYALLLTLFLLKNYKKDDKSTLHYQLEKKSYLLVSIISISIIIKLLLTPFFFNTLNTLSTLIPGAMCSAGVVSANEFGTPTIVIKVVTLLLALLWLTINKKDERTPNQPYFRVKLYLYILLYIFITIEIYLELHFFSNLVTDSPVLCCSTLYTQKSQAFLLTLGTPTLLLIFTLLFFLVVLANYFKRRYLSAFLATLFVYVSYYALVYFFATYIYELPTHKCPYCMLQKDYYFIGYFIYFTLFMGYYYSLNTLFLNFTDRTYKKSILFFTLFFLLTISSFILYLIHNHTLLTPLSQT